MVRPLLLEQRFKKNGEFMIGKIAKFVSGLALIFSLATIAEARVLATNSQIDLDNNGYPDRIEIVQNRDGIRIVNVSFAVPGRSVTYAPAVQNASIFMSRARARNAINQDRKEEVFEIIERRKDRDGIPSVTLVHRINSFNGMGGSNGGMRYNVTFKLSNREQVLRAIGITQIVLDQEQGRPTETEFITDIALSSAVECVTVTRNRETGAEIRSRPTLPDGKLSLFIPEIEPLATMNIVDNPVLGFPILGCH